ncbi:MAG: hypothetical protein ABF312_03780 [Candidatus Nanopelagicales bacterium]|nr:hypothetical protein [Actinomycetota bacterium]MBT5181886.1 hypothetical protein [Actinomycetota bacterium]MBT5500671.1 hypothetical protein [Actinomycetota bacterium]MDA9870085.1 hypothetical protein [bacterium]
MRPSLGRIRSVMDRVDTDLEIAEDIVGITGKVIEASGRVEAETSPCFP